MYSAAKGGAEAYQLHSVNATGTPLPHVVLPSPGAIFMLDVGADGGWIVSRNDDHRSIRALLPGDTSEREFSWLGSASGFPFLSRDGRLLVFTDESQAAGTNYAVMIH